MQEMKQLPIRFPIDVKAWLVEQAKKNGSSQNSEVIRAIWKSMDREKPVSETAQAYDDVVGPSLAKDNAIKKETV